MELRAAERVKMTLPFLFIYQEIITTSQNYLRMTIPSIETISKSLQRS